jgi:FRG domain
MPGIVSSYADLQDAVRSLPPPEPGRVRVFRGQNHDYPTMTPTALRRPDTEDMIWPLYASKLAREIGRTDDYVRQADDYLRRHIGDDFSGNDLDTSLLWVRAIKQHYGPGTEFLDVTYSVGVAAWFALHKMNAGVMQAVYGPPGPFDPETDCVGVHQLIRHLRFDETPGYLYVLDAIAGTASHGLLFEQKHGRLFDLALAPAPFSSSPRIRAQQACLIYADRSVNGGDLVPLFVPGTPLRIAWPLEGCPEVNWSTNHMFPPARDDDWYARFVSVPLAPNLAKSRARVVFDHPIAVTLYMPDGAGGAEDRALLDDLTSRFVTLRPSHLYAQTVKLISHGELAPEDPLWGRFADATALLLEGPMMTTIPPVSWLNLGLLPFGLADTAPARDFVSGDPAGEVSLRNVFIEISALDASVWESFESDQHVVELVRGLWLIRDDDGFFLTMFMYDTVHGDYIAGPFEISYDVTEDGSASFSIRSGESPTPLADMPDLERWFSKALAFVRSLSPRWKLSPSPQHVVGIEDELFSLARLEWALGEIMSLRSLSEPLSSYHVLRQWGSDEPFYGDVGPASPAVAEGIEVRDVKYAQVKPRELLGRVEAELAARDQRPPPVSAGRTNEDRWRQATEQVFNLLALPQAGTIKLHVCRMYLWASPPEAFDEHPREYEAVVAAAFKEGATWEMVAEDARMDVAEAQRRWGTAGPPPVPEKRRRWRRSK